MSTQDQIVALLGRYVKTDAVKTDAVKIEMSTPFDDLGLDSYDRLEFQMAVDETFGVEVSIDDFLTCHDIADIVALVDRYRAAR